MYEEKRSKKTRRKRGGKQKGFVPKPSVPMMLAPGVPAPPSARGRVPAATMPPPKHLPLNISAPPPSVKYKPPSPTPPPQKTFTPTPSPAVAMNTWSPNPPMQQQNNSNWESVSLPSQDHTPAGGLPPPPPPSKPVADDPNKRLTPMGVSPTPMSKAVNIYDVNNTVLNSSKKKKKKKKGRTDVSPNVKTDFSSHESPTKWIESPTMMPPLKQEQKNEFADFPSLKDRTGLPARPADYGSQISAGSKRKKKKRRKRLNKFKSTEITKPQSNFAQVPQKQMFVPKANPNTYTPPEKTQRGSKNSKNPTISFFGAAANPPNEAAFDSAMSKMKLKMDMKKKKKTQNKDFFTDVPTKDTSRQKSTQLQSRIQTQFGFLQSKFSHKEKRDVSRRPRRGQNRKGQQVPTLPPRSSGNNQQQQQQRGPLYSLY